jgi:uncharacterized SAM-binding protein YcdF (DUF218 family)
VSVHPSTRQRCVCCTVLRWAALVAAVLVLSLGVAGWLARTALLRAAADAWIVSDPPMKADAVAVFGGGLDDRPFAAAEYYRSGLVKKVLVSNVRVGPAAQLGAIKSDTAATRDILLKLGVADDDITVFGDSLANTHDEVLALREWARRAGARGLIVPTEIFSARRVRWMLHHAFGDDFTISVPALDPAQYHRDDWWRQSEGIVAFQNEILKYIYYRARY